MTIRSLWPAALLLAAACSRRTPPVATVAPQPTQPTQTAAAPAPRDTTSAVDPARARADSVRAQVLRDDSIRASRGASGLPAAEDSVLNALIHFGYDSYELSGEARSVLEQKAQLLRRHGRLRVEIAGHADDRGPDEYNLALGLRRAASARAFLSALGIDQERLSVVSFGEERPLVAESNEGAWAQNRRAAFVPRP